MLEAVHTLDVGRGLTLTARAHYVHDEDFRCVPTEQEPGRCKGHGKDDDYEGHILNGTLSAAIPVADGLKIAVGARAGRWFEENRRGTLELGYGDYLTRRHSGFVKTAYHFGGLRAAYHLEYVHKDQQRERESDQLWSVWRSKATFEIAW